MGLWNEPNLLIDGELVAAEGGAHVRVDQPGDRGGHRRGGRTPRWPTSSVRSPRPAGRSTRRRGRPMPSSAPRAFVSSPLRCATTSRTCARSRSPRSACRCRNDDRPGARGPDRGARLLRRSRRARTSRRPTSGSSRRTAASTGGGSSASRTASSARSRRTTTRPSSTSPSSAPALAAGCTVVLKGAPDTPLITLALGKLIAEHTDIPAGVVSVLTSSTVESGVLMTTDPRVDMITFTGSTPVGKAIMAAASDTLKKTLPRARRQVGVPRARRRVGRLRRDDGGDGHLLACRPGLRDPSRLVRAAAQVRRRRRHGQGDDGGR